MTVMVGETKYYSITYTKNDFDNEEVEDIKTKIASALNQIYKKLKILPKENIAIYVFPDSKIQEFSTKENKVFCSISDIKNI